MPVTAQDNSVVELQVIDQQQLLMQPTHLMLLILLIVEEAHPRDDNT